MMIKYAIFFPTLLILWGCSPDYQPATTSPNSDFNPKVTAPSLATVDKGSPDDMEPGEMIVGSASITSDPARSKQDNIEAATDLDGTAISPSGVIDLGDISQEVLTTGDGELVELPAPGVPRLERLPVETAKNDLAARININVDDILVVDVELKEWPDSSLGCPAEDAEHLALFVSGFRITLKVGDETYIYHTDEGERVILCEDGRPADL